MQSYADTPPETPLWFWEGRIPREFACLVAGDGGIGKGYLMCDLAARHTRGDVMPDGSPGDGPGWAITITPEDDARKVMAWRLRAAKAELGRVFDLTGQIGNRFKLPRDIPVLYRAISTARRETGLEAGMVLIDPLAAVSSIGLTSSNIKLREQLMEPLEALAMDTGVAMIINGHTVKSGSIAGSVALVQAARMVLRISRDKGDTRIRRIHVEKSNISSDDVPDVTYTVVKDEPAGWVEWLKDDQDADIVELGASQRKILDYLQAGNVSRDINAIAGATGIDYKVTSVLLRNMTKKGLVLHPHRGQWLAALETRGHGPAHAGPLETREGTMDEDFTRFLVRLLVGILVIAALYWIIHLAYIWGMAAMP